MSERFPVNVHDNLNTDDGLNESNAIRSDEITQNFSDEMNCAQAIKEARDAEARKMAELNQPNNEEDYLAANERDAYDDAYREALNQIEPQVVSEPERPVIGPEPEDYLAANERDAYGDACRNVIENNPIDSQPDSHQPDIQPEVDDTVLNVNKKPIVYVSVDQSYDSEVSARDRAEQRHEAEIERGSGIGKFINKIWKGNIAKLFYLKKYDNEALGIIKGNQNVNHFSGMSPADQMRATESLLDQFGNDDENDSAIHFEAGEQKRVHSAEGEYATGIKDIIRRNFNGEYATQDDFLEAHKRFVQNYRLNHSNEGSTNKGLVEVNNLFEIANAVRNSVEHGESLDNVLQNMIIVTGESRSGVRTESELDAVDKLVAKLTDTKIGAIVGPNTLAVASSIALSVANFGGRSLFSAMTKAFVPGVAASLWAGARENTLAKRDRIAHARQMARGEISQDNDRLRDQMESTRYETLSARDLMDSLDLSCRDDMFEGCDEQQAHSMIMDALGNIASIETRIRLSDETKDDFISYSNVLVGGERLELDRKLAEAKVILNNQIESSGVNLDVLYRKFGLSEYGPDDVSDMGQNKLDDIVEIISSAFEDSIENDVESKDTRFKALKAKRVAAAMAKSFVSGAVIGSIVGEFFPSRFNLVDKMMGENIKPGQSVTIPEAIFGGHTTSSSVEINPANISGMNSEIPLSGGGKLVSGGDNLYSMISPNNTELISGLKINPDGNFAEESIKQLNAQGIDVGSQIVGVENIVNKPAEVSGSDFVKNHINEMVKITHDTYYDNDTPAPIFENNELGLHRGENGGITDSGYRYNISTMTSDGSYHDGLSVDAKAENLKAALTINDETGSNIIMLDIDKETGNIDIPKDSLAAKLFRVGEDGGAEFTGAYFEVVQVSGVDAEGVTHINPLATVEGANTESIVDNVPTKVIENHIVHNFTENHNIVVPPIIPIETRETMKSTQRNNGPESGYGHEYGYGDGGDISEAEVVRMTNERSPRIISNPEAVLNPQEELNWYRDELLSRRGQSGLDRIDQAIDNSRELSEMSGGVETIVTVPVAAVQEADTIYNTLSLYGRQSPESLQKSLILLNLNWIDTAMSDSAKQAAIEKSRLEIERARTTYPDLKIAVVENEYNSDDIERTGGVIGYVAADLVDTTLMAIQKSIESGRMDPNHETLIIRNDADPEGISRNYLEKYQEAFHDDSKKDIDVFKGVTRFGVKWAEKYPGFAVASNFAAALSMTLSSRGLPATGGANFAIKASTLAAVGGLGVMERTGAGSDDGALGRRIRLARWGVGAFPRDSLSQTSVLSNGKVVPYRAVAAHVTGATVDTNPSRLVPYYINGQAYSDAWGPDFSSGKDGYRGRSADMAVTHEGKSEIAGDWEAQFKGIEKAVTSELHWNGVEDCSKALFIFFGHVPGSYTYEPDSNGNLQFKLTKVGKKYLKQRFEKEKYGKNAMSLYNSPNRQGAKARLISAT